jgi:phosphatidylglycerol:prolipoprotein diacylglycerol transferase
VFLRWAANRGVSLIPASRVGDAVVAIVLGVVAGGRLGYVFLYEPSLLWQFTPGAPWWGVLAIQNGGMSSHGGGIGVVVAAWRISRGWKEVDEAGAVRINGRAPMLHVLDVLALGTPVGLLLGRLANFVNGELLGRIVAMPGERAPWWAVRYPQEVTSAHDPARTPAQQGALLDVIDAYRQGGEGDGAAWERVLRGVQRGDDGLVERLEPLISARAPSQLVQALCEGVILGLILWFIARKPRRPGIIGCWFVICYGVMRIGTELVRLPDAHLGVERIAGLTRGQWYSGAMVAVGVVFLFIIRGRNRPKIGGWAGRPEPS